MNDYPRLKEMGVLNPQQIDKFAVYTVGNTDILRIVYDRKKGSLLPVSKRFKFDQIKKSVMVDSGTRQTGTVFESQPAFRESLSELEHLRAEKEHSQDISALILEEIRLLEEDVALRSDYIKSLLSKLK
ncbi:MAG: hypothetical protein ACI9LO_001015 [Planctomycetota bacterium]|jgi:hypothetical protein